MKQIGFWREREDEKSDLPWPVEGSGRLPEDTRKKVVAFLRRGRECEWYKGSSTCRICGMRNGSADMKNGEFLYPEGYAHYIEAHNVAPDPELIAAVLVRDHQTKALDDRIYAIVEERIENLRKELES